MRERTARRGYSLFRGNECMCTRARVRAHTCVYQRNARSRFRARLLARGARREQSWRKNELGSHSKSEKDLRKCTYIAPARARERSLAHKLSRNLDGSNCRLPEPIKDRVEVGKRDCRGMQAEEDTGVARIRGSMNLVIYKRTRLRVDLI